MQHLVSHANQLGNKKKFQCIKVYDMKTKGLSVPSLGTLEFLALSRSSDVSLLTAVPLLVLRSTLNARFNLLKERLLTEERSKFLTAEEKRRLFIESHILNKPGHACSCLLIECCDELVCSQKTNLCWYCVTITPAKTTQNQFHDKFLVSSFEFLWLSARQ